MELKGISFFRHVAENLYMVEGDGKALFPFCHSYLYDGDEFIAFDPQCGKGRLKLAMKNLEKSISDIDFIYNSHFHLDHTAMNAFLKRKSNAEIMIHEADRIALDDLDVYVKRYGMTDNKLEPEWRELLKNLGFKAGIVDRTFKDGEILPGGFQVIHTPGHAPGHCCFYKSEILISGDIDLTTPWVGNLSSSVADYLNTIDKLKKFEIKLVLPGHRQIVSEKIPERLESFRQRFINRETKILNALPSEPITLDDFTKQLFQSYSESQRKQPEHTQAQFALHFGIISTLNYLKHLETLGKVQNIVQNGQEYWVRLP